MGGGNVFDASAFSFGSFNKIVEKFHELIGVVMNFKKTLLSFPTPVVLNHIKDSRLRTNHQH